MDGLLWVGYRLYVEMKGDEKSGGRVTGVAYSSENQRYQILHNLMEKV